MSEKILQVVVACFNEKFFLEKIGDDNTPEYLVMDLSSLRIKGKERVKEFNQRFSCLKNRIPTNVLPSKELLVDYYIKVLPSPITMWFKGHTKIICKNIFQRLS